MAYRGYTQAQNKATQKYHKENLSQKTRSENLPPETPSNNPMQL